MARYAWREVLAITLLGLLLTAAAALTLGWWALLPGLLSGALLSFYRDPPRRVPLDDRTLLSPADGKVMCVERRHGSDGCPRVRIVIFLSVANVHVNRSPCRGRVADVRYRAGQFLNALRPAATELNERSALTLEPPPPLPGPVEVTQIAGLLARRIVCAVRPGDALAQGQRFGMIKLGSQTELTVPDDPRWHVLVRAGQAVRGGLTPLLRFDDGDATDSAAPAGLEQ